MYLYTIVLLFLAAVGLAQYPLGPNITDLALTYQFDVGLGFFENDPQARAILNGPKKVTVLTVLNIPFNTYVARLQAAPPSDAKDLLINGVLNLTLDSELVRYLILDGVYSSASLFGGLKFLPSFLVDRRTYLLSQPAKVGIFNDKTGFYIRTGENFTSDIVLKDIPFSNGLIHVASFPYGPPRNISATGIIVDIKFLNRLVAPAAAPFVQELTDVTVFAPVNRRHVRNIRNWTDYFFAGEIAYSTTLASGKTFQAYSKKKLVITEDKTRQKYVNGVKILSTDVLTSNGVVHTIDGVGGSRTALMRGSHITASRLATFLDFVKQPE